MRLGYHQPVPEGALHVLGLSVFVSDACYHQMGQAGRLKQQTLIPSLGGDQKSEVKVSAGLVP